MSQVPPARNLVLGIVAQNENQSLRGASSWFGDEMVWRGYRHTIIDMFTPLAASDLKSCLASGDVAFAYGFAGVGSQFHLNDGTNLWTATRTPYLALWHDPPCYNYRQHIVDSPYIAQVYHVRDHFETRRDYLPASSSPASLLSLRHGVAASGTCRPFRERERKIYYVKTGINPDSLSEGWRLQPQQVQEILWVLLEAAQKDRNLDVTKTAALFLQKCGKTTEDLDLLMGIAAEVDAYIRAWRSDRLVRSLVKFPSIIVGRGWDYLKSAATKGEFSSPIPFDEYVKRIPGYRILANSNPLWRDGIHERVSHGLQFGCITMTDRSEKSDAMFGQLPNYVGYEWQDDLDDVIAHVLKLADNDTVDYLPATSHYLDEHMNDATNDYFARIFDVVQSLQNHSIIT